MKGNRPSMILTIPKVDAVNLGELIAFYETSVIIQGLLLNINSFDQWGVELGKKTAEKMLNALQNDEKLDFDSGTNNQIKGFRN
jgi:glucose-6-phosphate isomerase